MKKFLLGLLVGVVLTGLTLLILFFSLAKLGDTKPVIATGSTLLLKLEGDSPEKAPVEFPLPIFGGQNPVTILENYTLLRQAATDTRVKSIIFMPHATTLGWAKMQEIREGLLAFKKSGKPLVAYLHNPSTREYYMATACDRIYLTPTDLLDFKGLRLEGMFLKGTLDKIGAQLEFEYAGKYKDFGDMFTRTSFTPESKEALNAVLDGIYGTIIQTVAESRKKTPEQVRALIDQGPYLAKQAKAAGLVDELYYEDELYGAMKKQLGADVKKATWQAYAKANPGGGTGKKIAVITGDGSITRGSINDSTQNENGITALGFIKVLRQVTADSSVSGVILRVDSPGGDAIASDDILREVKLLSQKKPLVISMSDTAASGGYYIAATGDPIIAYPNTLTGSIGVGYGKVTLRGTYDKLGITKELLTRGANAEIDSDYYPITQKAHAKLREGIDDTYRTFLQRVADARKKPVSQIEPLAQGRVWLGSDAKKNGLVDELGGLDTAVTALKNKGKLGNQGRLVAYPPRRSLFEQLFSRTSETNAVEAAVQKLVPGLDLKLWQQGGMMAVSPYLITVK